MYRLDPAPWLFVRAWNTDQSPKNDWVFNTAGNALSLVRKTAAPSVLTLSAAANATDWAPGKVWQVSGNLYRVGISTASISGITGLIGLAGTFTGGTLDGVFEDVTAYDPSTNPNSTVPPTASANATAVRAELATELAHIDASISSRSTVAAIRTELAVELGRIDQNVSAAKTLTAATLNTLFDDTNASQQLTDFFAGLIERFDEAGDTPVSTIVSAMLAGLISHSQWIELLADAEAARAAAVAAGTAIGNLPAPLNATQTQAAAASAVADVPKYGDTQLRTKVSASADLLSETVSKVTT